MAYHPGDRILSINGISFTDSDPMSALKQWQSSTKGGEKVVMIVAREMPNGKVKKVKLRGNALEVEVDAPRMLMLDPNATSEQMSLRKAWLKG